MRTRSGHVAVATAYSFLWLGVFESVEIPVYYWLLTLVLVLDFYFYFQFDTGTRHKAQPQNVELRAHQILIPVWPLWPLEIVSNLRLVILKTSLVQTIMPDFWYACFITLTNMCPAALISIKYNDTLSTWLVLCAQSLTCFWNWFRIMNEGMVSRTKGKNQRRAPLMTMVDVLCSVAVYV